MQNGLVPSIIALPPHGGIAGETDDRRAEDARIERGRGLRGAGQFEAEEHAFLGADPVADPPAMDAQLGAIEHGPEGFRVFGAEVGISCPERPF